MLIYTLSGHARHVPTYIHYIYNTQAQAVAEQVWMLLVLPWTTAGIGGASARQEDGSEVVGGSLVGLARQHGKHTGDLLSRFANTGNN